MTESASATGGMPEPTVVLLLIVGLVVILSVLLRKGLGYLRVPAMVGYVGLGVLISYTDGRWQLLGNDMRHGMEFLAKAGIVALLFRVGLESKIVQLIAQIRRASFVWAGDVLISFAAGYLIAREVLGFEAVPSLVTGAALSATSLGVAAAVWRDAGTLKSKSGALLTDVAELDDISGVILLALILAIIPTLQMGQPVELPEAGGIALLLILKFALFCGLCFLFARFLERPLIAWFLRLRPRPTGIVVVTGLSFIISGVAGILGFSLAIGALFAGLAFSRDPAEHRIDKGFEYIYQLFSPFFFVGLGLGVDVEFMEQGLLVGLALFVAAAAGKFVGAGVPTWWLTDRRTATLVGLSMIPRAEIALVVAQQARYLGAAVVPPELFGGLVTVSLLTCLMVPPILQRMLRRGVE